MASSPINSASKGQLCFLVPLQQKEMVLWSVRVTAKALCKGQPFSSKAGRVALKSNSCPERPQARLCSIQCAALSSVHPSTVHPPITHPGQLTSQQGWPPEQVHASRQQPPLSVEGRRRGKAWVPARATLGWNACPCGLPLSPTYH